MAEETKPAGPPTEMASTVWEGDLPDTVRHAFETKAVQGLTYVGQNFFTAPPDVVLPLIEYLKKAGFDYLVDLSVIDYPKRPARFELLYILYSYSRNERIRVKTTIADGDTPPTATSIFLGANWMEREAYDFFGIVFKGHPKMKRILNMEDINFFPLRKDFPLEDPNREDKNDAMFGR